MLLGSGSSLWALQMCWPGVLSDVQMALLDKLVISGASMFWWPFGPGDTEYHSELTTAVPALLPVLLTWGYAAALVL